jgi:5-methylcytosine-specific restriction endonuclease McrA
VKINRRRKHNGTFAEEGPKSEAKAKGEEFYFTGTPCVNGHIAPRFTSNGGCSECLKKWCGEYHIKHKDKENQRCREYAKKDPVGNAKRSIRWAELNPDKFKEIRRRTYWNNPEFHREQSSQWAKDNPEKTKVYGVNRRTRLIKAGGKLTHEEWESIKEQYGHKCLCCGKSEPEIKLTIDHIIPLFLEGMGSKENIQPLCKSCNCKKMLKIIDYRGDFLEIVA